MCFTKNLAQASCTELTLMKNNKDDLDMYVPRYSTRDHWTQESIKRIFNSELFWAVRAAEKKKSKLP